VISIARQFTKQQAIINNILIASFIFFIIWGFVAVAQGSDFIFDRFFSAGIVAGIFVLYRLLGLRIEAIIFALAVLLFHHLKLYGNFYFGIPFDQFIHFAAGAAIASVIYSSLHKSNIPLFGKLLISIFAAAGIASTMEIIEFIGYANLGSGEGLLFYGTGDFGEWNNTVWDMINNTLGAVSGSILSLAFNLRKVKNK
jgi:hypothetical protein